MSEPSAAVKMVEASRNPASGRSAWAWADPRALGQTLSHVARRARDAAGAHQRGVDRAGGLAALPDRPDDQRLAAAGVAAREDAVHAGSKARVVRVDVAALAARKPFDRVRLGADEAEREQAEVGFDRQLAALDLAHRPALPLDAHRADALELAAVALEGLGQDRELPLAALFVRGRGAQDHRPLGPR